VQTATIATWWAFILLLRNCAESGCHQERPHLRAIALATLPQANTGDVSLDAWCITIDCALLVRSDIEWRSSVSDPFDDIRDSENAIVPGRSQPPAFKVTAEPLIIGRLAVRLTSRRDPVSKIVAEASRDELCIRCRLTTSGLRDAIAGASTTVRKLSAAPTIAAVLFMMELYPINDRRPAVCNISAEASLPNQP
jgi:hypothetical protein